MRTKSNKPTKRELLKMQKEAEEKLDKEALKNDRDEMRSMGEELLETAEEYREMDSYEQLEAADRLGLSAGELRKMVDYLESLGKRFKKAEVEAGYDLEVVETITGSELDEPIEDYDDITVLKINGKWVCYELLRNYTFYNIVDRVF